jgi:hypothetical protein
MEKTLGGDRLGSGKKMKVAMRNYERSTHDLGYIWRSTMAPGTLVPFMKKVALPGDTFDINLEADVKTHPTLGPLFGSFKLQLDVFMAPIRLYQAALHNNKLGIGLDMDKIKLPNIEIQTKPIDPNSNQAIENQQISQSSLLAYLGIRGNGYNADPNSQAGATVRTYNGVPILAYWDIYKNYYANKQEGFGAYITRLSWNQTEGTFWNGSPNYGIVTIAANNRLRVNLLHEAEEDELMAPVDGIYTHINEIFQTFIPYDETAVEYKNPKAIYFGKKIDLSRLKIDPDKENKKTIVGWFDLDNIDEIREKILQTPTSTPFSINTFKKPPFKALTDFDVTNLRSYNETSMNGLGLKTYNSDIFNNWLSTEYIEGNAGINEITAVDTSGGSFNIDTLILAEKVYNMLNRIAVSGGTYEDWLQAVYSHEGFKRLETPVYMGGMSKEVIFQEVVSLAGTENEPLATLAGRGTVSNRKRGGKITIKVDEPSYIIGIVSLTPRIDYSQGNDWDTKLTSINDLHKPALDQIGFQDLPTWEMAAWEMHFDEIGHDITFSAGKQPAWINYMTDFNRTYGNFADPDSEMFMTLNRRYEINKMNGRIADLTTYIDPQKFNYIFAQTERDAQNFWIQIACDITARRKMSAKIIPNL